MKETKEKAMVVLTDNGIKVRNEMKPSEVIAYLIDALCEVWSDAIGTISVKESGERIVHMLHEMERVYKIDKIYEALFEDEDDEEDEFDGD